MSIEGPRKATERESLLFPVPKPRPLHRKHGEKHDQEELQRAKKLIDTIDQSETGIAVIEVTGKMNTYEALRLEAKLRHYCGILGRRIQVHEVDSGSGDALLILIRSAVSSVESLDEA